MHGRGGGDAEEEAAGADPDVEVEPPQHPGDRVVREEQGFGLTANFQSVKLPSMLLQIFNLLEAVDVGDVVEDVSVVVGAAGAGDCLPGVLGEHPAHEDEGGRQDDGDEDPDAVDEHPSQQQKPDLRRAVIKNSPI